YLRDLLGTYWLGVPLVVLILPVAARAGRRWRTDRTTAVLLAAPVGAGPLHALYVVRVDGESMHARLQLPSGLSAVLPRFEAGPATRSTWPRSGSRPGSPTPVNPFRSRWHRPSRWPRPGRHWPVVACVTCWPRPTTV